MHRVKQQRGRWVIPVLVAAAIALVFAFPALASADFQLTIQKNGTGTGTVKCSVESGPVEACDAEYPEGTELALIPEAGPSSEFIEFSGDCGPLACELLMDEAHTAVATFDLEPGAVEYPLTIAKAGTGTGTVQCEVESGPIGSCAAEYPEGTELTVLAEADLGSKFSGFSGACSGSSCELTMNAAKSVTATFDLDPAPEFALTITKAGSGTGTVLCEAAEGPEACKAKYPEGTEVALLPTADSGSNFAGFSGACSGSTCTLTMDAAKSVTATFNSEATPEFTLTVNKAGTGTGTVQCKVGAGSPGACAAKYPSGTSLTLIATANGDSEFAGYSSGTGSIGCTGTGDCSFTLTANSSVTATFNLKPVTEFTLTVNKAGTGTGTVKCKVGAGSPGACAAKYPSGTTVTLIAEAGAASEFAGFSGACTGSSCVLTMNSNKTVTATFNLITYALAIEKIGTGTGTVKSSPAGIDCGPVCEFDFADETKVTLTATPDEGSAFDHWTGSGCNKGTCVVTMARARTIKAVFDAVGERTLTVSKAGTGAGTVISAPKGIDCGSTCAAGFPVGKKVTLLAGADAGSTFTGFSGACTGTGPCQVTMSEARSVTANFELNANITPTDGLVVVAGTAKVKNGKASLRVFCNGPSACKGELKLGMRVPGGTKGRKRFVVIGKASFDLQPGASTVLQVKISRRALAALEGRKALAARVVGTGIHAHAVRLKNV
jgi:hypothetical protein